MPAIRSWPTKPDVFDDAERLFRRYLLKTYECRRFIRPDTVFTTLGSCFATNIGRSLEAQGFRVHNEMLGEEINSTYANRYLLQWIADGTDDFGIGRAVEVKRARKRERMRRRFAETNAFVLTLGVAPCFFDRDGRFVLKAFSKTGLMEFMNEHTMRTTTFAENLENLRCIVSSLRQLADDPEIVLTISPVPLLATTELYSAVAADCVSKSVLRAVAHEYLATDSKVQYWPSFEMARWLGSMLPNAYGEDGNMRHVSPWLIEIITRLFLEHHSERQAAAATA